MPSRARRRICRGIRARHLGTGICKGICKGLRSDPRRGCSGGLTPRRPPATLNTAMNAPPPAAAPLLTSFAPLARADARVLILGSMPGAASLAAQRYYAYPHNQFWSFMGALCGAGPELAYDARVARLLDAGIAVWDVLRHCQRPGSLDTNIQRDSEVANDFAGFFAAHRQLRAIFLNGGTAAATFRRHVRAQQGASLAALHIEQLPSSSPAHAGRSASDKLRDWSRIGAYLRETAPP